MPAKNAKPYRKCDSVGMPGALNKKAARIGGFKVRFKSQSMPVAVSCKSFRGREGVGLEVDVLLCEMTLKLGVAQACQVLKCPKALLQRRE